MNQKGFANIILVIIIVILVGLVGYFAFIRKPEAPPVTPTPSPTTEEAELTSSKIASDFMRTFKGVALLSLTHIQTDNGSEFADHFEIYCDKENIVHFHAYPRCPKMQGEIERFNHTPSEAFISKRRIQQETH